jgi:SAM-dependent methyltransferase
VRRPDRENWFDGVADFLGTAYLRNAFTMGTRQEVDFLVAELGLAPGSRVLDLGCGPGRHSLELARRGIAAVGIDQSETFIALATQQAADEGLDAYATFRVGDVRTADLGTGFDAVICLCQGGFGLLLGEEDPRLVERFSGAVRAGGRLALSAFHSYFALRWIEDGDEFDPASGVNHEVARLRDAEGRERDHDLWTTCFTAKELRLLAAAAGLDVDAVHGVTPGDYGARPPALDRPELLLLATVPTGR